MTLLGIAALCSTAAATAQTALDKALPDFIAANAETNILTKKIDMEDYQGKKCTLAYYVLRVKKNDPTLKQLRKAFAQDEPEAYHSFIKMKGSGLGETVRVGYGANPSDAATSVTFGSYADHNYQVLLFRDKADAGWRTCYALCWYDDPDEDKSCKVFAYKMYSPDPKAMSAEGKNKTIKMLDGGMLLQVDSQTGDMRMINADLQSEGAVAVKTSTDFVVRLNNLRTMYKNGCMKGGDKHADGQTAGIVNVVLAMCKQHAGMLDADEKQVCETMLRDMQNCTPDSSLKKLLDLAVKYLK